MVLVPSLYKIGHGLAAGESNYVPSLYKTGCGLAAADEQLRFSLGAFHQPHCYCPPTRDKELRLSSRWAHKTAGDDDEMLTLFA